MRTLSRQQAIEAIRNEVLKLVDDEHCMCAVAAEKGIYCGGFKQWDDAELFKRYDWLVAKRGLKTREEVERFANKWQLARQVVQGVPISCDVQKIEHDTCDGWDGFTNPTLERFHRELLGETVRVRDEVPASG